MIYLEFSINASAIVAYPDTLLVIQCYFAAQVDAIIEDNVYPALSEDFTRMQVWIQVWHGRQLAHVVDQLKQLSLVEQINAHAQAPLILDHTVELKGTSEGL